MDPLKNIFDPRNSHKNYDPCEKHSEQRNPRKIQPTQPMQLRNSQTHVTHITRQPM